MECRRVWNREFMDSHFTRSWIEGELKEHRQKILFDHERSLLPSSQWAVTKELALRQAGSEMEALIAEAHIYKEKAAAIDAEIQKRQQIIRDGLKGSAQKEEHTNIACPHEFCRGFLSQSYKCGTCLTQFCASCRLKVDEHHACDPGLVATIAAIMVDSKPCPSCGTAISRVSGCDQMFCTQCDTAFSYKTGKKEVGVIHNPHYFDRLFSNPNLACNHERFGQLFALVSTIAERTFLSRVEQTMRHVEAVELRVLNEPLDNLDLRVQYLLNELDDKTFRQRIQQRDRKHRRFQEIRQPLELFIVTSRDFLTQIRSTHKDAMPALFATYERAVETFTNEPLRAIGARYANRVPIINMSERPSVKWMSVSAGKASPESEA